MYGKTQCKQCSQNMSQYSRNPKGNGVENE